jgi:hypothetical protein
MNKNLDIITHAVTLIIKVAIMAVPAENSVLVYLQGFTYNCQLSKNYQK